ncbi:MAG: lysophospholipase [Proteobacteria bacterium]|nr:lysophospholipase [Pseudomonadota bacterium]
MPQHARVSRDEAATLSFMLLDHPIITERLFFPRKQAIAEPFRVRSDDAELACYRFSSRSGGKASHTFIHFHGNGEVVADYIPDYVEAIAALGRTPRRPTPGQTEPSTDARPALSIDVVLAEYRGYGGSTGTPGLVRMLDDVDPIVAAIGRPVEELWVYGRSLGSIYAIELAHRHPGIGGLVIESGIADMLERLLIRVEPTELGVTRDELARQVAIHLDHQRKLSSYTGPLLVIHARDDDLIDPSHATRNHEWAASNDKQLVLFESGGHNALLPVNWTQYLDTLERFLSARQ